MQHWSGLWILSQLSKVGMKDLSNLYSSILLLRCMCQRSWWSLMIYHDPEELKVAYHYILIVSCSHECGTDQKAS